MSDRRPRYTLEGPCESWALQGRDGVWYRVCVPCDTVIPAGGSLPRHLGYGYRRESDAWMSVRGHVRDMAANRVGHLRRLERYRQLGVAARAGDFEAFGILLMGRARWETRHPRPDENPGQIMADYLESTGH